MFVLQTKQTSESKSDSSLLLELTAVSDGDGSTKHYKALFH